MKKLIFSSSLISFACIFALTLVARAQNVTFANDLSLGASGSDVINLQTWLITNGFDIPSISSGATAKGYFGRQTQAALIKYQASVGLPAYGFFGPMTRARIGGSRGASLQVLSPNGGEMWQLGTAQYIRWTGAQGILNQTADIKLEYPLPACAQPGQPIRCMIAVRAPITIASNINLNSGSYAWNVANPGQYKIQICLRDGSQCAESADYFTITASTTSNSTTVLSPNGGEVWPASSTRYINWSMSTYGEGAKVDLYLGKLIYPPCMAPLPGEMTPVNYCQPQFKAEYTLDKNVNANVQYGWIVATDIVNNPILPGQYAVEVCMAGSTTNCDASNSTFTISDASIPDLGLCPAGYTCIKNQ